MASFGQPTPVCTLTLPCMLLLLLLLFLHIFLLIPIQMEISENKGVHGSLVTSKSKVKHSERACGGTGSRSSGGNALLTTDL